MAHLPLFSRARRPARVRKASNASPPPPNAYTLGNIGAMRKCAVRMIADWRCFCCIIPDGGMGWQATSSIRLATRNAR